MSIGAIKARAKKANTVIRIISDHGHRYFYSPAYNRVAALGLDKVGQVWYIDCLTGMKIYPFGDGRWPGFSNGRTLQALVAKLAQYIVDGIPLALDNFPLENDVKHWAYGQSAMKEVRRLVLETGAVKDNDMDGY